LYFAILFLAGPPKTRGGALGFIPFICFCLFALYRNLRYREKIRTSPPRIIIDDRGLWVWRLGGLWNRRFDVLIPWSELQSVKYGPPTAGGDDSIRISFRDERYGLFLSLMDSDGHRVPNRLLCKEIEAYWERNRGASTISTEPLPRESS
jgi:hypothetical protein